MQLIKIVLFLTFAFCIGLPNIFAQPQPCGDNPQMTSTCAEACVVCDIDGFTGVNDLTATGQGFDEFCTTQFNNMQYIAFVAGTVDLTIQVDVGTCVGGINSLEVGFFQTTDCENFVPITICDTDIQSNTSQTFETDVDLTIGQYYYLIIDGSNGANCNWTFNVTAGSTLGVPITNSGVITEPLGVCPDIPATFSTEDQVGVLFYEWTLNGVVQLFSEANIIDLDFPSEGVFEVCVTASNICSEGPPSCITVTSHIPEDLFLEERVCTGDCYEINDVEYCETGVYQEIVTLPSGCDSTISLDLTVLETAFTALEVLICNGDNFPVGNTTFEEEGNYEVPLFTVDGCDSLVALDLTVIECEILITPNEVPVICNGTSTGTLIFSVDQGEPPLTWTYTNLADPTITGTGMTNILVDNEIPNVPVGLYNIYVTDNFGNDAVVVQEVTQPTPLISDFSPSLFNGFNVSCAEDLGMPGNDGSLMISSTGGIPSYMYEWSNGQTGPMATDLAAKTYTVTITDNVGCEIIESFTLTAPPPIIASVDFIDPNCVGFETGQISVLDVSGGIAPFQYSLDGGAFQTSGFYEDLMEGNYQLQIMDANGCIVSEEAEIFAPEIPVILVLDDVSVTLGCEVLITPELNISEFLNITWIESNTLDCENCLTPSASPLNTTSYILQVTSIDSCSTEGTVLVTVEKDRKVYIPNVFTPNDDGLNDIFTVYAGKQVKMISSLSVYDRWGNLVFKEEDLSPNDISQGWDGTFNGKNASASVYAYHAVIEYLDDETSSFSGDVLIMR